MAKVILQRQEVYRGGNEGQDYISTITTYEDGTGWITQSGEKGLRRPLTRGLEPSEVRWALMGHAASLSLNPAGMAQLGWKPGPPLPIIL